MNQNEKINLTLNITAILQSNKLYKIRKEDGTEELRVNIDVFPKKETDKFGYDIGAALSKTKEERLAKEETRYCGRGKTFKFEEQNAPATAADIPDLSNVPVYTGNEQAQTDDDLPF